MMTFQPSKLIMTRIMIRASFAALPPSYQEFWPTHLKILQKENYILVTTIEKCDMSNSAIVAF